MRVVTASSDDGIVVDEVLTSSDPRMFAAGDVACARHPFYGEHLRVEHWGTARDHGRSVAQHAGPRHPPRRCRTSSPTSTTPARSTAAAPAARTAWCSAATPRRGEFLAFWLRTRRVLAGMNVNNWDVREDVDALIRSGTEVDPDRLADRDVPLTEVYGQPVAASGPPAHLPHFPEEFPVKNRYPVQVVALLAGAAFLLVGVLGFVPGITTGYSDLSLAGRQSEAQLLGLFQISVLHNLVHALFGVAGLLAARTVGGAHGFLLGAGAIYLVLTVYGFAVGHDSPANFVPVNAADNLLHLGLGAGMLAAGLVLGVTSRSASARR